METWKDIKGYEGLYQVSDLGRVKSLERYVRCGTNGNGKRKVNERILKAGAYNKFGHVSVFLRKHGIGQPVHKLVMEAFVGKRPKGLVTCHNDGDPENNRLGNLRYDTESENQIDIYRYGKKPSIGKLTPDEVEEIRYLLNNTSLYQKTIAKKYGIAQQTVSRINTGRTFSWLDDNGDWRDAK